MSRARDTANQINRVNSSAADATALTVDSSENVLIGTTNANIYSTTTTGINLNPDGATSFNRNGGQAAMFNRINSDGDIVQFRKDGTTVGSIGSKIGHMYLGTDDVGLRFSHTGDYIYPVTANGGTGRDNAIGLGYNGSRFKDLYLSGGVYLGGTGSANKLEDYEEGNWTPTAVGGVTSFSIISATYTKVGRNVSIAVYLTGPSGNSANMLQIGGLPFTPRAENYNIGPLDGTGSAKQGFARTNHNSTTINCYYTNSTSGVRENLEGYDVGGHILFGLTYQTT